MGSRLYLLLFPGDKLLLFSHAFERFPILLLINEPAGFCIPFRPVVIFRVLDLGSLANSTLAMTIARRGISRHKLTSLNRLFTTQRVFLNSIRFL